MHIFVSLRQTIFYYAFVSALKATNFVSDSQILCILIFNWIKA